MQQTQKFTTNCGIAAAAFYLPGNPVDIKEWGPRNDVSAQLIGELLENGCRYFYDGSGYADVDLIDGALDRLLAESEVKAEEINFLIHASTQSFSVPAPPTSVLSELMTRFDLRPELSFSVGHLACASTINAIMLAAELLESHPQSRYALVVTCDRVFGGAEYRVRQNAGIQSDGGSAILIARENPRCRIGHIAIKNFSELHAGPSTAANRVAIGRYTWLQTKELFLDFERVSGQTLNEYSTVLPINADAHYWRVIAKSLNMDEKSFFLDNIKQRGHACSVDLVVNLLDRGLGLVDQGGSILICGQSNVGAHAVLALLPVTATVAADDTPHESARQLMEEALV